MADEELEKKEEERLLRSLEKKKTQPTALTKRESKTVTLPKVAPIVVPSTTPSEPKKPSVYVPIPRDFNKPLTPNEASNVPSFVSPRGSTPAPRPTTSPYPSFISPRGQPSSSSSFSASSSSSSTNTENLSEEDKKRVHEEEERRLKEKKEIEQRERELVEQTDHDLAKKEEERMMKQFGGLPSAPSSAPSSASSSSSSASASTSSASKKEEDLEKKFMKQLSFGAIKKRDPALTLTSPKGPGSASSPASAPAPAPTHASAGASTEGTEMDEEKKEQERMKKQLHLASLSPVAPSHHPNQKHSEAHHDESWDHLTPAEKRERETKLAEEREKELRNKAESKMAAHERDRMFKQLGIKK